MAGDRSGMGLSQLMSDTQTQLPWHHLATWYRKNDIHHGKGMRHTLTSLLCILATQQKKKKEKGCIARLFPLAEVSTTLAKVGRRCTSYCNIWVLSNKEVLQMFNVIFPRPYLYLIAVLCKSSLAEHFYEWISEWIDSDSLARGNVSHREHRKQSCTINGDYFSGKKKNNLFS